MAKGVGKGGNTLRGERFLESDEGNKSLDPVRKIIVLHKTPSVVINDIIDYLCVDKWKTEQITSVFAEALNNKNKQFETGRKLFLRRDI